VDLTIFHEALLDYVRGAVRSPSFPMLISRCRVRAEPPPSRP
jgi:hypothetical protein